jgi:hypothetical protein
MGALTWLTGCLIWERYGYPYKGSTPPDWYETTLPLAKQAAQIAKPANCRWSITNGQQAGDRFSGTFTIWDEANPWTEPWSVNFTGYTSEEAARNAYAREFTNHERLHSGTIDALLHYQATSEPIQPAWMPDTAGNYHWLQPGYKRSEHLPASA